MTHQDSRPDSHSPAGVTLELPVDLDTVDKLEKWTAEANQAADRLSALAGHHRAKADEHRQQAEFFLDLASRARAVGRMRAQFLALARERMVPALEGEELRRALAAGVSDPPGAGRGEQQAAPAMHAPPHANGGPAGPQGGSGQGSLWQPHDQRLAGEKEKEGGAGDADRQRIDDKPGIAP